MPPRVGSDDGDVAADAAQVRNVDSQRGARDPLPRRVVVAIFEADLKRSASGRTKSERQIHVAIDLDIGRGRGVEIVPDDRNPEVGRRSKRRGQR